MAWSMMGNVKDYLNPYRVTEFLRNKGNHIAVLLQRKQTTALYSVTCGGDNKVKQDPETGKGTPMATTALESVNLAITASSHSFLNEYPVIPATKSSSSSCLGA